MQIDKSIKLLRDIVRPALPREARKKKKKFPAQDKLLYPRHILDCATTSLDLVSVLVTTFQHCEVSLCATPVREEVVKSRVVIAQQILG